MAMREVQLRRFSVVSVRPFAEVVGRLTSTIGRPDMNTFHSAIGAARTAADLEAAVQGAIGSSDLMEFVRFDAGEVLRKERNGEGPNILRLIVGNPLIMKKMARAVSDAAAYAPITILLDERADGVHLSYDSMARLLAPYENEPALAIARNLDAPLTAAVLAGADVLVLVHPCDPRWERTTSQNSPALSAEETRSWPPAFHLNRPSMN
jgi:hypothetical protein